MFVPPITTDSDAYQPYDHVTQTVFFMCRRNYEQLGLDFQLYLAEILFNRGLCAINLGRMVGLGSCASVATFVSKTNCLTNACGFEQYRRKVWQISPMPIKNGPYQIMI